MQIPYLSVIVPSYNEQKNIDRSVLDLMLGYLLNQKYSWELILSDDGSNDGTAEVLEKFAQKDDRIIYLANIHAGKAPTVKAGMLTARGTWRLFTDFDQSTPLSEVEVLLKHAEQGAQVVVGSREIAGAHRDKEPIHRHIMGRGFNLLVQILAVPGFYDTQCGFKLFSAQATELLFSNLYVYGNETARTDAFTGAFDVELLYLARKAGLSMIEVPIKWEHNASERVSPIKDSLRMFRDIVKIRLASRLGKYNAVKSFKRHGNHS